MSRFVSIPTQGQTNCGLYLPLRGPFIHAMQHQENVYEKMSWDQAIVLAANRGELKDHFDLNWGQCVYQRSPSGMTELAGFYWDTSD